MAEDNDDPDVDALTIQLAELHVADILRRQKKVVMPDSCLVAEMEGAACKILGLTNSGSRQLLQRKMIQIQRSSCLLGERARV